jgi:uncharacterized protein (TIGR01319 family)
LATAATPTTLAEVMRGVDAVRADVERTAGVRAAGVLACSSAGGGLRIAVVGYERLVTAEAGRRVALSAGGRVVHVHSGRLAPSDLAPLRSADVVLLVGGTDGGNEEVLRHNARRLGIGRVPAPVVLAGNAAAADDAAHELLSRGRRVVVTPNVLPRIGVLEPAPARAAIREVFLRHVIGGKGLSRGPGLRRMLRAATPDAVLAGVEALSDGGPGTPGAGDVLVVDVGGATTDVYSVVTPTGEDAVLRKEVVAPLWRARTVEGDLGMRWNAPGVVAAARAEALLPAGHDALAAYAAQVAEHPAYLPDVPEQDVELARLAVTVAARRHGRAAGPTSAPRPLRDVRLVVGSGGVLRHHGPRIRQQVLEPLVSDHAGGWRVPAGARLAVDEGYLLFAAGLLREHAPAVAARLAGAGLRDVPR